jgi:hypothetical protein
MPRNPVSPASTVPALHAAGLSALALIAAVTLEAAHARAEDLVVRYDQAQLLRLPRPVAEIVVGNPSIADVSIQGANLLVITGKTFGVTNVIALDSERNIIQDQRVTVERDQSVVNLHRGTLRETYNCNPHCQSSLTIGDDAAYFKPIIEQSNAKTRFSESGSEPERSGQ